jgi:cytochrome P450
VRVGPYSAVVVTDPELTRQMLVDDHTFDKGGFVWDTAREVAANGLATCPHSEHRQQRRLVQPTFHHSRLAGYAEIMAEEAAAAADRWRDGQVLDIPAEMTQITARVVQRTILRAALSPALLEEMLADVSVRFSSVYRRMLIPPVLRRVPLPGNARYTRARFRSAVGALISERSANPGDQGDLLSALVAPDGNAGKVTLSEEEIIDQISLFFAGGVETSASTLTWALHQLSQHPETEQRLHAEIDTAIPDRWPSLNDLTNLPFVGQVVTETLRFYPPTWILTRVANVDSSLGGHDIPAGTHIIFSPYLIHHRPDVYPEPERFDPDRWGDQAEARPRHHFLPFGYGPRRCIGDAFGFTEMAIVLAVITARWRFQALTGEEVRVARGATLRLQRLHLRVVARVRAAETRGR